MKTRHKILLALAGGIGAYEVWALTTKEKGDTISEITWDVTSEYPLVPFLAGVVVGHFWWQSVGFRHPKKEETT